MKWNPNWSTWSRRWNSSWASSKPSERLLNLNSCETCFNNVLFIVSITRNLEETQALEARHQAEVSKLRALIQQQKKEYDDVTSHMRELAEAQWNTVNRVHHPSAAGMKVLAARRARARIFFFSFFYSSEKKLSRSTIRFLTIRKKGLVCFFKKKCVLIRILPAVATTTCRAGCCC